MNLTVSPTEALTVKGTYRRTPWVGATITVWVLPLPLLPEEEDVDEGGIYMLDGLPYWATHSVTSWINYVETGAERNLRCTQLS